MFNTIQDVQEFSINMNTARDEDKQHFTTHAIQAKDLIPHNFRWCQFYGMNDVIMQGQELQY